ncbi:Cub And Zona Pellucida-Like Domain-Containing Protein 1 [Manis pentadactyla]|nr:Cub And Zona Pellucida-Like Domain-Containing Protein 1 [Manis pentadactyla]
MEAVRRLIPLALLIVSCLAELNSTESEGKSSCRAILGGASQTDNHKALILQLNPKDNCTWTVESPENKSIRIIFSYFQLDPDGGCESENIEVFDGNSTEGSLLGRVCSANDYVPVFESSSNTLTVQIVTDSARIPRSVFIFYYFFSPGTCNLEVDEHCRFDFVAVYDGSSTTSGLLGQVCGRVRPTFESSSDSLTVVLSTDYANSYWGFSASYTSIYAENVNTTSLTCFSDRMRAIISKSYLASLKYSENSLQLNNPTCRPRISNVVEFSIPLDGCGTIKKVEDHSITYTNIITLIASPTSELITRQKHLQIIMKCEMEHNSTVEMMYITADDVIQNQNALGKYNTSMALFESNVFEKPILESPYYVDLNQTLYVQVSLYTSDPNLVVFLDTCTASPTSDFVSPTYDLIKSGCIQDETCEVYPLSEHYGRFQFNAFKFLKSLGSVYLQCKVLICDSGDHQSRCSSGCVSRGKRDISSYKWKTDSVIGPIRLKRDRSASGSSGFQDQIHGEETQNQPFNSLHLFSFMVLVLNVVIVATVITKHFVNQRTGYKYQKLKACNEGVQPQ